MRKLQTTAHKMFLNTVWMLGNLARASYVGSSDYMWPYSFSKCNENGRKSQEISGCDKVNHYGLAAELGRGAPEIDLIEAMQGDAEKLPSTTIRRPYQSCSLQIAPGVEHDRPVLGLKPKEVSVVVLCCILLFSFVLTPHLTCSGALVHWDGVQS